MPTVVPFGYAYRSKLNLFILKETFVYSCNMLCDSFVRFTILSANTICKL